MLRFVYLLATFSCIAAYKFYQDELPNGDRIPHPCKANYLWPGLGHKNELGGGSRNPFGLDFAAAGQKWTTDLCNKDSDGDGQTNGAELGDPTCVWKKGDIPAKSDGLSHPGVCQPFDSPSCKANNDWDFCKLEEFACNATNSAEVTKVTLLVDDSPVPAQETTYVCQHFVMPTDQDYHVIATKPEIDNQIVMHHILVFGCMAGSTYKLNSLHECGMSNGDCSTQLGGWSVGGAGHCLPDNIGLLVGKNSGFTHFMIQLHWNNPQKLSTYKDHSGISLYLTPTLRQYSGGSFLIGQNGLNIPPKLESHEETATCRSSCTRQHLNGSFFIFDGSVHMHYLGKSGVVEHYRNGTKIGVIVDNQDYSYDRPTSTVHKPPIEFKPGDEMKLKCEFKSTSRTTVTRYGDGTQEEMCLGFISVYPQSAIMDLQYCIDYKDIDLCAAAETGFANTVLGECHIAEYIGELEEIGTNLYIKCQGLKGKCPTKACKEYVDSTLNKHPCRMEPAKDFLKMLMGRDQGYKKMEDTIHSCKDASPPSTDASSASSVSLAVVVVSALFTYFI